MDQLKSTFTSHADTLKRLQKDFQDSAQTMAKDAPSTMDKYKKALEEKVKNAKPEAEAFQKETLEQLMDMSQLSSTDFNFVIKTYSWLVFCFFVFGVATIPGYFLGPIVNMLTGNFVMFLNVWILIPAFLVLYTRKTQMSEDEAQLFNLCGAGVLGLSAGYWWSARSLSFWMPCASLGALGFAIAGGSVQMPNRQAFLGACAGIAGGLYLAFGLVFGIPFSYILWVLLYTAAFVADLQLKLGQNRAGSLKVPQAQMCTLVLYSILYNICFTLHGMSPEDAAAAAKSNKEK